MKQGTKFKVGDIVHFVHPSEVKEFRGGIGVEGAFIQGGHQNMIWDFVSGEITSIGHKHDDYPELGNLVTIKFLAIQSDFPDSPPVRRNYSMYEGEFYEFRDDFKSSFKYGVVDDSEKEKPKADPFLENKIEHSYHYYSCTSPLNKDRILTISAGKCTDYLWGRSESYFYFPSEGINKAAFSKFLEMLRFTFLKDLKVYSEHVDPYTGLHKALFSQNYAKFCEIPKYKALSIWNGHAKSSDDYVLAGFLREWQRNIPLFNKVFSKVSRFKNLSPGSNRLDHMIYLMITAVAHRANYALQGPSLGRTLTNFYTDRIYYSIPLLDSITLNKTPYGAKFDRFSMRPEKEKFDSNFLKEIFEMMNNSDISKADIVERYVTEAKSSKVFCDRVTRDASKYFVI